MAEDKKNEELVFDGMPGADPKTEEDPLQGKLRLVLLLEQLLN